MRPDDTLSERIIGCAYTVADMVVDGSVIVEIKASQDHSDFYTAQCLNYLRATGKSVCLLLNFGKAKIDVRRYERAKGFC